ncbi:hypothetical protein ACONUD_00750 [Microbulbifer harenosus]|uniref:Uncharacterized protein n=1 Tax=Microbulbifer harenosus TaxID=2576840 RepID=A0ABY2UMV1_9GAMM|nr:hypothetical protein [Microbulbifer harenosus]TLM79938.1 hypothetical protein FDY93_00745 [Microbulbifer harenosus]
MLEARIKFYDIKKCGYYQRAAKAPLFGGLDDTLSKLSVWAKAHGRTLINTTTYEPDPDKDILNTYFCDWFKPAGGSDSVLVLWNEVQNDKGVIYGMNPNATPGERSMRATDFGDEPAIPGSPSYFWFIPNLNVFATVIFEHSMSGKQNLDFFIKGFMANKSPYRVFDPEDGNKVIGYSRSGAANADSSKTLSHFFATGRKQDELEQELLQNRNKIRKLIKRETLQYTSQDGRNWIERIFSDLTENTPEFDNNKRTISHELQFEPTDAQIRQIVNSYSERGPQSSIKNIGFVYNDQTKIMLSGKSITAKVELNVNRRANQIIRPQSLLAALTTRKTALLQALDEAPFEIEEAAEETAEA